MNNFSDSYDSDDERIIIDDSWSFGCNRCIICNQHFKHSRSMIKDFSNAYIVKDNISHSMCNKNLLAIRRKKNELLELEFKQFLLKAGLQPSFR